MAGTGDLKEDSALTEVQKKIHDAFEIFDHEQNQTVDVRELGTIVRSLGCCPSEADIQDIITEIEEEDNTGYARLDNFLPLMTKILMERKFKPEPEAVLVKAFTVLDVEMRGYLLAEELTKYMTEEGEPFSQEEMEEMLSQAMDPETGNINYHHYAAIMAGEEH